MKLKIDLTSCNDCCFNYRSGEMKWKKKLCKTELASQM